MSEWVDKSLKSLVSFKKGKKVDTSELALDGYQPYLGASSLTGGEDGFAMPSGGVTCAEGDALMLWDGERSGLVGPGKPGVISSTVMRLRPEAEMSGRYLVHCLRDRFEWIQARRTGTGVPHVPKDLGRILNLCFPSEASEQATICDVLDAIDAQIETTEALIAKQERVRTGLMQDLFTRGVDEQGQLRRPRDRAPHLYHQTELGWLPVEWNAPLLDSVANRVSGHTPNRLKPEYWNGGVKWVSLADSSRLDRPSISETTHEISPLGIQKSSAQVHPRGTVFVSRDAGVGKSSIMAEPMAVSQHFIAWICQGKLNNLFLYYYLQYNKRLFENIASGSTIVTIGLDFFKRMRTARPDDADEQKEIANVLKAVDDRLDDEKAALAKLRLQKTGLMQDLLTGKVSAAPLLKSATT